MIKAEIVADSIGSCGNRITTVALTYPRFIHAEVMTHRVFSRNAASSRAIPVEKFIQQVQENPALPVYWGKNQKGMQAKEEVIGPIQDEAKKLILELRDISIEYSKKLLKLGLHKQITNRYLEPWFEIKTLVTSTDWDNFFGLRTDPDAQPEFLDLATKTLNVLRSNVPTLLKRNDWHLPFVKDSEKALYLPEAIKKLCTARCARVSYLNFEGTSEIEKDVNLHDMLMQDGHMSPFEHLAENMDNNNRYGNFVGWKQYRKSIPHEDNFKKFKL